MSTKPVPRPTTCPKCRTKTLRILASAGREGAAFSCCECAGIWVRTSGSLDDFCALESEPVTETERQESDLRAGLCPSGHGLLTRARVDLDPEFFLDRCSECAGVWFDQGEWQRVAVAGLSGSLPLLWTASYQREHLRQKLREDHRARLEARLGSELLERVETLAGDLANHPCRSEALAYLQGQVIHHESAE